MTCSVKHGDHLTLCSKDKQMDLNGIVFQMNGKVKIAPLGDNFQQWKNIVWFYRTDQKQNGV